MDTEKRCFVKEHNIIFQGSICDDLGAVQPAWVEPILTPILQTLSKKGVQNEFGQNIRSNRALEDFPHGCRGQSLGCHSFTRI